jgi:hypothetical protein
MRFSQVCADGDELTCPHGAVHERSDTYAPCSSHGLPPGIPGPLGGYETATPVRTQTAQAARTAHNAAPARHLPPDANRKAQEDARRDCRPGRLLQPPGPYRRPRGTGRRFPQPTGPVQRADPRTSHGNRPAPDRHRRMSRRTTTHPEHGRGHCHPTISAHDFGRLPRTACRLARDGRTYARSHTRTVTETYNRAEPREPPSRPLHGHESRHPSQRPLTVGMRRTTLSPQCVPCRAGAGRHPASLARAGGASPPVGSGR